MFVYHFSPSDLAEHGVIHIDVRGSVGENAQNEMTRPCNGGNGGNGGTIKVYASSSELLNSFAFHVSGGNGGLGGQGIQGLLMNGDDGKRGRDGGDGAVVYFGQNPYSMLLQNEGVSLKQILRKATILGLLNDIKNQAERLENTRFFRNLNRNTRAHLNRDLESLFQTLFVASAELDQTSESENVSELLKEWFERAEVRLDFLSRLYFHLGKHLPRNFELVVSGIETYKQDRNYGWNNANEQSTLLDLIGQHQIIDSDYLLEVQWGLITDEARQGLSATLFSLNSSEILNSVCRKNVPEVGSYPPFFYYNCQRWMWAFHHPRELIYLAYDIENFLK